MPSPTNPHGTRDAILIAISVAVSLLLTVATGFFTYQFIQKSNRKTVLVNNLKIGDCFSESPDEADREYTDYVIRHSCKSDYQGKIYAITEIQAGKRARFPGEDALSEWTNDYCYGNFYPALGESYETSEDDFSFFYPAESAWREGDRKILCYAYPMDDYEDPPEPGSVNDATYTRI